eukprot:5169572-Amphidinium_carterae.1
MASIMFASLRNQGGLWKGSPLYLLALYLVERRWCTVEGLRPLSGMPFFRSLSKSLTAQYRMQNNY